MGRDLKTAWLIYGKKEADYNKHYISLYFEEGKKRNVRFELVFIEQLRFGTKNGELFLKRAKEQELTAHQLPDFAIVRTIYPLISIQLERMGVRVYNSSEVAQLCNDKARTMQFLAGNKIRSIDTWFCKSGMDGEQMREMISDTMKENNSLEKDNQSMVVKTVDGHGGQQVYLANADNIRTIAESVRGHDLVIQPLVGTRHQDLRVYVIGDKIIGAVLRTAKVGFKSNFSLGGSISWYSLNCEEICIINKIISLFSFGMVGIDFLVDDEGKLVFNEMEDVVGARMLYQCSHINLVGEYLDFILSC